MAKKRKHNKKRANNEGSVYFNKKLNRWVGFLTIGYRNDGKLIRRCVYGRSQGEVTEKMNKLKYEYQAGLYVAPEKLTVGEWIARYLEVYVKPTVRVKTYTAYL